MTDKQLTLHLQAMLGELDTAIEAVRDNMPEGAERESWQDWKLKPEYANKFVIFPDEHMKEYWTEYGEYFALAPLTALREAWQERVESLAESEATGD